MMRFESDNSPIMQVVRRPVEAQFSWSGELRIILSERELVGSGSVSADASSIHGRIDDVPTHALFSTQSPHVVNILGGTPGKLIGKDRLGEVRPASDDLWRGERVILEGFSPGSSVSSVRFLIGTLIDRRSEEFAEAGFERFVYQGGSFNFMPLMTDIARENGIDLTRDRISGTFSGRQLHLRNLTDAREPSQSFIAAIVEAPALTKSEADALWLLICFLNGARVRPVYQETFDVDARLIERRHQLGIPFGVNKVAPFDYRTATPTPNALEVIGNGFLRMIEAGFPIAMMIHHLNDATTSNPETDSTFLLFAIHTAFEAWSRAEGIQSLIPAADWDARIIDIERAIQEQAIGLPDQLKASLLNRVRGANQTSMGYRERFLFESLAIELDREDRVALRKRNELFHNGYLRARFAELTTEERQLRIDMPRRLRNLVNLIILKLVGYDGFIEDALRHGQLRVMPSDKTPFIGRK